MQCRILERRRVPQQARAWELAKNACGEKGRLPRRSQTDADLNPSLAFLLGTLLPNLSYTWAVSCTRSQTRALFCALPQGAVEVLAAIQSPHTSSSAAHTCTALSVLPRLPANTSTVVHASTGARPSGRAAIGAGGSWANSHRPWHPLGEHRGVRSRSAPWCSFRASLLGSLSRFLAPSLRIPLPLSLRSSLSPPGPPSHCLPPGRTCSRRRSRMQWGALRARASRSPQQPPGLAGSRMLRPPRTPLAVPRCPHRPHGGRLYQPEALQQGSVRAEER